MNRMPPDAVYCKACGGELGDPKDVLHDPNGYSPVAKSVAGGPIENPDDHHIHVVDGPQEQDYRYQCAISGQITSLVKEPPTEDEDDQPTNSQPEPTGSPSGGTPTDTSQKQPKRPRREDVYDISPDQDAMDILEDVITNEAYGLGDGQIREIKDWGDIYDGQIPPDKLEAVLKNMSGISNQKASLMRDKYEAKITKWVRETSEENAGPRIGAHSPRMPNQTPSNGGRTQPAPQPPRPQPQPQQQEKKKSPDTEDKPSTPSSKRKSKREMRVERRQEALDKAFDRAAEELASNFATDFGTFFTDAREIFTTVLRKKAESDPEWFFEKMEKWDMDLFDEVMEASEEKKSEQKEAMSQADMEVDNALQSISGGEPEPKETEPEPSSNVEGGPLEQKMEEMMEEEMEDSFTDEEEVDDPEVDQLLSELEE